MLWSSLSGYENPCGAFESQGGSKYIHECHDQLKSTNISSKDVDYGFPLDRGVDTVLGSYPCPDIGRSTNRVRGVLCVCDLSHFPYRLPVF